MLNKFNSCLTRCYRPAWTTHSGIKSLVRALFCTSVVLLHQPALAQQGICVAPQRPVCPQDIARVPQHEFTFSRLIFADNPVAVHELGDYVGFPHWQADCSDSDPHFISAIKRMTRINTNNQSQSIAVMDQSLFDYPALYMVEAGFASFTQTEAERMREYLLRGGFLLVDDFHGSYQWSKFAEWIGQIFPDREWLICQKTMKFSTSTLTSTNSYRFRVSEPCV